MTVIEQCAVFAARMFVPVSGVSGSPVSSASSVESLNETSTTESSEDYGHCNLCDDPFHSVLSFTVVNPFYPLNVVFFH